jgi:hypothetical protein
MKLHRQPEQVQHTSRTEITHVNSEIFLKLVIERNIKVLYTVVFFRCLILSCSGFYRSLTLMNLFQAKHFRKMFPTEPSES